MAENGRITGITAGSQEEMDAYQIAVAQEIFEWWWATGIDTESVATMPLWEKCHPRIQAFWMDGAWRSMRVEI